MYFYYNWVKVLFLNCKFSQIFRIILLKCRPGDTIQADESEYSVLPVKLNEKLSPTGVKANWDIDPECLGVWYRPNFDNPVVKRSFLS